MVEMTEHGIIGEHDGNNIEVTTWYGGLEVEIINPDDGETLAVALSREEVAALIAKLAAGLAGC